MKRFVDLRQTDVGCRFAFWDTVTEEFEEHCGSQAWVTWKEFVADYRDDQLERYKRLCPEWVFAVPKDEEPSDGNASDNS